MKPFQPSIECLDARIAPAGLVLATYDPGTGALAITGDDLDNSITIFQTTPTTWRVEGKDTATVETSINEVGDSRFDIGPITQLTVVMGNGNDRVEVVNLPGLLALSVDTGAGNDVVKTEGVIVAGNAAVATGAGADSVDFEGLVARVGGNLNFTDPGDGLTVTFGAERVRIGGAVVFVGSTGTDIMTMATETILRIGAGINFTANGGLDQIAFGNQGTVSIGRDALGRSVFYQGGVGPDRISIGGSAVRLAGSVEMKGEGGNDTVDIDGLVVGIGQSIAGLSVQLSGGAGADQIDLQGGRLSMAGLVQLDGGIEADKIDLTDIHRLTLQGGLQFTGGTGADELKIGVDSLLVTGSVLFAGGDDADTVRVEANGSINGLVSLLLDGATAGLQSAEVLSRSGLTGGLVINGALNAEATGAAASSDVVKLTNLNISGRTSVRLGEGASVVDLDNLKLNQILQIETRGGNDEVEIERDGNFEKSIFAKAVNVLLGDGDDVLLIGKGSTSNRGRFLGALTADGGSGSDSRNDIAVDNLFGLGATYSESLFEVLVLTPP